MTCTVYMKMSPFFFLLLFFSFLSPHQAKGQELTTKHHFINIPGEVSKSAISSITQDCKKFMWIGTNGDGLYRFDGSTYKAYHYKNGDTTSISSNLIHCTYIDSNNQLWIGTENGLNLYNQQLDQFRRIPFNSGNGKSTSPNISIYSLSGDEQGNLLVGSFENGLYKYTIKNNAYSPIIFQTKELEKKVNINAIKTSPNGTVFVATNYGLKLYDSTSESLKEARFYTKNKVTTITEGIESIYIDTDQHLWVGTLGNGLLKISHLNSQKTTVDRYPFTNKRILSIVQVDENTLMIGTENDGLFHINIQGEVLKNYTQDKTDKNSIQSNSIWSLFRDQNKRIWIGYYNNGLGISDTLFDKFKHLESLTGNTNSLQSGSVTGIVKVDQEWWLSMDGGGIDIYDALSGTYKHINKKDSTHYTGLLSDDIQTLFIDSHKNIWAGSWNSGIFFLKKGSKHFINYNSTSHPSVFRSNKIISFSEDSKGTIWIGTFYNGLMSYHPKTNKFTHYDSQEFINSGLYNSAVRKVLVDSNDHIWVGTTQGLYRVNQSKNGLSVTSMADKMSITNDNPSSSNHILALYEDANKQLWIGTRGAGLFKYSPSNDDFLCCNKLFNFNKENISSIIEDAQGLLWISSNSGIASLDRQTNQSISYTTNDGLLSNHFNFNAVYKDKNGLLYFGNYQGLDYFTPKEIVLNLSFPKLHLSTLKLFNKTVTANEKKSPLKKVLSETEHITLSNEQSVFTIEYNGISYTRPEKNNYAYYLEGLEESWNYVGNLKSATYTNLDHGDYIFKLKAANNDGIWTPSPLELKITILPPWWKTNWALALYLFSFTLAVYLLNKITQHRLQERQLIRDERNQRAQMKELHEKKLQFFTNISHEFRTPLTLIINPLEDIIRDKSLQLPANVQAKHQIIRKNTNRLHRLIIELMDFRKLELNKVRLKATTVDLVSFTTEISSYFKQEAFNRNIYLSFDSELPSIRIWADEQMLEKIIFNILSNAFKVTPDGGNININILQIHSPIQMPLLGKHQTIDVAEIVISDTGPGLKKNQIKHIFERFYQVENLNKTYYGGTGIGLEVVQNFVKMHYGKIEVDSTYGKGTSFKIYLPLGNNHFTKDQIITEKQDTITLRNSLETQILPVPTADNEEKKLDSTLKPHTILIVEDNTELRNYLKTELKKNYKVLTAKNGKEGLPIANEALPDIILTDVIMPEMDGLEFCKALKTELKTSHIPILMLTAKTRTDDRIEGIKNGADAYIAKPFDLRVLKTRLSQLITSRQLIFDKYFRDISGKKEQTKASSLDKEFIEKVLKYIHNNMSDSDLSVELLASEVCLSRSQLYRKIKSLTGQTVNVFLRQVRLKRAKQLLENDPKSIISEVCYKVGFSSPSYFTKCFKSYYGFLPTEVDINETSTT